MGRPKSIRLTKNDIAEINKLERNRKAKINRTLKNYGVDLSDKVESKKPNDFKTRKELNAWKQEVKSFTSRYNTEYQFSKNKYGVVASKKQLNELKLETKRAQRIAKKLEKKVKDKPFMQGGKQYGTVEQRMLQMGSPNVAGIYVPPDFDFDKIHTKRQLQDKAKSMKERSDEKFLDKRSEGLKNNYAKTLAEHFNSDADSLIEKLDDIPASDFFELYLMHDELQFTYLYTEEQRRGLIEQIDGIFERYKEGKVNMDLKGF